MFKNSYQSGFLSILYSIGSKPLQIWDKQGAYMYAVAFGGGCGYGNLTAVDATNPSTPTH
jgi:hypothetical protein